MICPEMLYNRYLVIEHCSEFDNWNLKHGGYSVAAAQEIVDLSVRVQPPLATPYLVLRV